MLSLTDLRRRIASGTLTPDAALDLSRAAITAREAEIGAFAFLDGAARGGEGPLAGIAVGVKDIIDTADMPTEMGSPIYAGWRPRGDAPIVTLLRNAGAALIGKTTTTAFAHLAPTATRNPRNTGHTPGGSSAGSAAAVAAGMVPLAIGTQTGGSVIRPASYCGVAAIKPSYRLLPTVGIKTFSWALDTVGLFAASVADCAEALAIVSGRPELATTDSAATPRIALVTQDFAGAPEPESAAALSRARAAAERAGARISVPTLPPVFAEAWRLHPTLQDYEAIRALGWEYAAHREAIPEITRGLLDRARDITAAEYDGARRTANEARKAARLIFGEVDAILTFSAPGPAPATLASTGDARFNRLWTMLGLPCVNVAGPMTGGTLPVGVQVIAGFGRDRTALAVALLVEKALSE